jgi:hypothetical protein
LVLFRLFISFVKIGISREFERLSPSNKSRDYEKQKLEINRRVHWENTLRISSRLLGGVPDKNSGCFRKQPERSPTLCERLCVNLCFSQNVHDELDSVETDAVGRYSLIGISIDLD